MHLFNVPLNNPEPLSVLAVELELGSSLPHLLEQLYKFDPSRLALADALIIRPPVNIAIHPGVADAIAENRKDQIPPLYSYLSQDDQTFVRFPKRPVYLLFSHDYVHQLSKNINPTSNFDPLSGNQVAQDSAIESLQKAEVDWLIASSHARFPRIDGTLYRAPSGDFVPSFLRVGNVQFSRASLDAFFFWLLPSLRNCRAIIAEIWSIGSIALNASRRLASYDSAQKEPCPVEMLGSYFQGSDLQAVEAAEQIEKLINITSTMASDNRHGPGHVLIILSGINTGASYRRLHDLLRYRLRAEATKFVALFNLGETIAPVPCLRDLSRKAGDGSYARVEFPSAGADIIEIDRQIYFPSQFQDFAQQVRKPQIEPFSNFLSRYSDASLVRVHQDVTDAGEIRHYAIWIDTVALCTHPVFKKNLMGYLRTLQPIPRLIITPPHDGGNALGAIAAAILREFEPAVEHISHPNLILDDRALPENERIRGKIDALSSDSAILILDNAFITGKRLSSYQRSLRGCRFTGRVHYLVAIARPSQLSVWAKRGEMLRSRTTHGLFAQEKNTVEAIESFALPSWTERECPWCNELRLYQRLLGTHLDGGLPDLVGARRRLLEQSRHRGMEQDLFLVPPGILGLHFTPGSKFAEPHMAQASVFGAVASAVQMLRASPSLNHHPLGPRHYPIATVLKDEEYLENTFSDSMLRACFLRAALQYELNYTNAVAEDQKTERAIRLLVSQDQSVHDVAAELVLATLDGKFPRLHFNDQRVKAACEDLRLTEIFGDLTQ